MLNGPTKSPSASASGFERYCRIFRKPVVSGTLNTKRWIVAVAATPNKRILRRSASCNSRVISRSASLLFIGFDALRAPDLSAHEATCTQSWSISGVRPHIRSKPE
jgi:hypothetical protein